MSVREKCPTDWTLIKGYVDTLLTLENQGRFPLNSRGTVWIAYTPPKPGTRPEDRRYRMVVSRTLTETGVELPVVARNVRKAIEQTDRRIVFVKEEEYEEGRFKCQTLIWKRNYLPIPLNI